MNGFTKFPAIVALAALSACAQAPEERSLYQRLGGEPAMTAVVDDFIANVAANPAINPLPSGIRRQMIVAAY